VTKSFQRPASSCGFKFTQKLSFISLESYSLRCWKSCLNMATHSARSLGSEVDSEKLRLKFVQPCDRGMETEFVRASIWKTAKSHRLDFVETNPRVRFQRQGEWDTLIMILINFCASVLCKRPPSSLLKGKLQRKRLFLCRLFHSRFGLKKLVNKNDISFLTCNSLYLLHSCNRMEYSVR